MCKYVRKLGLVLLHTDAVLPTEFNVPTVHELITRSMTPKYL